MIWVAWRQHRKQALIEAGVIAAAALLLLLSGYQMLHVFKSSGLAKCLATAGADCGDLRDSFTNHYNGYQFMIPLFLLAPVLFGMFFGAPLIALGFARRLSRDASPATDGRAPLEAGRAGLR